MFNVDSKVPSVHEIGRKLGFVGKLPPKVESKVANLVEEIGSFKNHRRITPQSKAAVQDFARKFHVDYEDSTKVHAVGLIALRRALVVPNRDDIAAFQKVLEKQVQGQFEAPIEKLSLETLKEIKPVQFEGSIPEEKLLELEEIVQKDEECQLKRDLQEWITKVRATTDHRELVETLVERILVDPITYATLDRPCLFSDGRTYEKFSELKLRISPFTREELCLESVHVAAYKAVEWAANLLQIQGCGEPYQSGA